LFIQNSDIELFVSFRQPLKVQPGIVAKAISAIQNALPVDSSNGVKQILLGLEDENTTDESFLIEASFVGVQFDSSILRDDPLLFGMDPKQLKSADLLRPANPEVVKAAKDHER
jgi:hypothetical protein